MTALKSLACNPNAFVGPNLKEGKFMDDIMYSKRKNEWLVDFNLNEERDSEKEDDYWSETARDTISGIKVISGVTEVLINFGMVYLIPS